MVRSTLTRGFGAGRLVMNFLGLTRGWLKLQCGIEKRGDVENRSLVVDHQPSDSRRPYQRRRNLNAVAIPRDGPGLQPLILKRQIESSPAQQGGARQRWIQAPVTLCLRHRRTRSYA